MEFIHERGTTILQAVGGPWAPQIYVSLMQGARNHMLRTCSAASVFRIDNRVMVPGRAKHSFPGFTIRFSRNHAFVNSARVLEVISPGDYQGQFHWYDGQERLAIDASSFPLTSDGSGHTHFSVDFAYYSLLIIFGPVIQT